MLEPFIILQQQNYHVSLSTLIRNAHILVEGLFFLLMTKSANSLWREGVTFEFMHFHLSFPSVLGKRMTDISGDFKNPKIKGLLDRSIRAVSEC